MSSGIALDRQKIESVLDAFTDLPARPDVKPAFDLARSSGFRIIALTNGSAKTTKALLSGAALSEYVEKVISIDDDRELPSAPQVATQKGTK